MQYFFFIKEVDLITYVSHAFESMTIKNQYEGRKELSVYKQCTPTKNQLLSER